MKRKIGIVLGITGIILIALVIAVISGVNLFAEPVNVIGGADSPTSMLLTGRGGLRRLFTALFAGIVFVVISYIILFKNKK